MVKTQTLAMMNWFRMGDLHGARDGGFGDIPCKCWLPWWCGCLRGAAGMRCEQRMPDLGVRIETCVEALLAANNPVSEDLRT
jgi:hypothetical protein